MFFKKIEKGLNSSVGSYIFALLAALACAFLYSADWAYGWIAALYPLGDKFVPLMFALIIISWAVNIIFIILQSFSKSKKICENKLLRAVHILFELLSVLTFFYTFVLLFGLDSGISAEGFMRGLQSLLAQIPYVALAAALPLLVLFAENSPKTAKAVLAAVLIPVLVIAPLKFASASDGGWEGEGYVQPALQSKNILENATVSAESLKKGEKPDAENLLGDTQKCWTPQNPMRQPAEGFEDGNNSYAEIKLASAAAFNTAMIEEVGNEVQYFRIQAYVNDEWVTVYKSEKIQAMRLCSFDAVTTDRVRLCVDKFRDNDKPAKIRSFKLYNEPVRESKDFEVTAYQRLDGDVPTEILAKGEEYVKNYAKFYDVYTSIIVFGAINWDENGDISFGEKGEENFAKEISALKEIISHRSNKEHRVKLIITGLADGAGGDHGGVNGYMSKHLDRISQQIISLVEKYDFDGVDVDWEYPATAEDWKKYDTFMAKLYEGINKNGKQRILSTALSSGNLGLSKETFDIIDQIQFMAYDGNDTDGYQSSLDQAQVGIAAFQKNGADISKINIGIAAYGRPINNTPYWANWRDLEQANYWDSKYYNVPDGNQIYDGTFCAPALAGDKTAYALFSGCGGVMVFRVACDKTMDNPNSVACGIENTLNRYFSSH